MLKSGNFVKMGPRKGEVMIDQVDELRWHSLVGKEIRAAQKALKGLMQSAPRDVKGHGIIDTGVVADLRVVLLTQAEYEKDMRQAREAGRCEGKDAVTSAFKKLIEDAAERVL